MHGKNHPTEDEETPEARRVNARTIQAHYSGPMDRNDLSRGQFGAVAPLICECGLVWGSMGYHMSHRATLESPEEGADYCPDCGSSEIAEHTPAPFKAARRYTIHRHHRRAA